MQIIKIDQKKGAVSFKTAHELANEKAKSVLGEYLNIAFYNDEQKLVSPTLISCSGDRKEDCGADSYAKSLNAELEIDVNERFRFYYRHVENYDTPSPSNHIGMDPETIQSAW